MHDGRIAVEGTLAELLSEYSARIEFDLPDGVAAQDVPFAPAMTSSRGSRFTVATDDLEGDLEVLLQWARTRNLRLGHLEASDATLNELFQSIASGATGTACVGLRYRFGTDTDHRCSRDPLHPSCRCLRHRDNDTVRASPRALPQATT